MDAGANARSTRQGSMTHFGLDGDGSTDTCHPPATCGDTTARSWDPDITGPFNHKHYGGWYLAYDHGTPTHLSIQKVQLPPGAVMVQAMSVPAGTSASQIRLYAESSKRFHNYTQVANLAEVRSAENGDRYFLDTSTDTLYWRVITGYVDKSPYVDNGKPFGWIPRDSSSWNLKSMKSFTRAGLTVVATASRNQFQLHIKVACEVDSAASHGGAFCKDV